MRQNAELMSRKIDKMLKYWFLLFTLLTIASPSFGETKTFHSYKAATETPYGDVTQLLEDSHGYLWISTLNGLVRFDGFDYKLYKRVKEDITSIPHDVCFSLFEDSKQQLWVATGRGLAIYNREKDNFISVPIQGRVRKGVYKILEDQDGTFWSLTYIDLLHYDQEKNTAYSFPIMGNDIADMGNSIWITSDEEGIRILDKKSQRLRTFDGDIKHARIIRHASNGDIYVGTSDNGFYVIGADEKIKKHVVATPSDPYAMADNFVQTLYEDKSHKIWIGNRNGNVAIFNPTTLEFEAINYTLPTNIDKKNFTTYSILEDSNDNIWLGTHQFWLLYANKTTNNFTCYQHNNRMNGTISGNPISCISQTKKQLFIGTDGGGLNTTDLQKRDNFNTIGHFGKVILDVQPDVNENRLWIATWDNGLFLYDWQKDAILRHYAQNATDSTLKLPSNNISSILVDGPNIWLGTSGMGVVKIETGKNKVLSQETSYEDPFSIEDSKYINHLMKDSDGWIWISSSEGLRKYKDGVQIKFPYSDKENELPQNQISCCYEDSQQRIWVLTATSGIVLYDKETNGFKNYSKKYDIPTDLKSIQEDENGMLWLIARNRIIEFSPSNKSSKLYELEDGSEEISFNAKSIHRDNANNIYIGSNYGMFAFNPNKMKVSSNTPHILLKDLYIWDKQQISGQEGSVLKNAIQYTDTITLGPDQNDIRISFIAIDFEKPNCIRYSYMLEGLSKEWKEVGKDRSAAFSLLSPGKYKFKLKATSHDGTTYEREKSLTIIILPHWWQTWWFIALCILIPALLAIFLYNKRTQYLISQKTKLEGLVADRTSELEQQAIELKQKKDEVEKKNAELDEMLTIKNRILSIIAHDLKNPLTSIVGLLSLLLDNAKEKESQEYTYTKEAARAAKKLQEQMENILEWARIQTKAIFYSPNNISIAAQVKDSVSLLKETAEQKNITITIEDDSKHFAFADGRMVGTILRNLINNAIKFTNENGKILIKVEENEENVILIVKDNGVGMDQETAGKLFDKEVNATTFGTNNEKGSGLGLKICHDFVITNKGTININSEKGKGTTITILLPLGDKMANDEIASTGKSEKVTDKNKAYKQEKPYTIVVVDDNSEILTFLCALFQNDFNVEKASDGKMALEKIQKTLPDIILSDITMPKMDGKELLRQVKSNPLTKHIPVVLLTSDDTIESQLDSLTLRADDYMTKPFDSKVLQAKVKSILSNRELVIDHLHKEIISTETETKLPESRDDQFLRKIKEVLQENISESNLSVEFIAEKTALSRVQLFRKFKTITGNSPSEYIKNFRLQHAAKLLESGKFSVADVAYEVGFSDPKYFGICFSEKFKMSPSAYAKQAQEGKAEEKQQE